MADGGLSSISSAFTVSISQGTIKVITVDGEGAVAHDTPAVRSIGLVHPGERMDLIVDRGMPSNPKYREHGEELTITLDRE